MRLVRVLFACIENSNRSQIAEAYARELGAGVIDAHSAGSAPSGVVSPRAIAAMREVGYDLSSHRSKHLDEAGTGPWDLLVTMGCGDACPLVHAASREDWDIADPATLSNEDYIAARDEIGRRVSELVARFKESDPSPEPRRRPRSHGIVGWLAITLAAWALVNVALVISGISQSLVQAADSAGALSAYNFAFGIVPTVASLGLLAGYWWMFRGTPGQLPAFLAIVLTVIAQVLATLWPVLTRWDPRVLETMGWIASLSGLAVLFAIAVAVDRSAMLPRHVAALAYSYFGLRALLTIARVVVQIVQALTGLLIPQASQVLRLVGQYGGTGLYVAFLISLGLALLRPKGTADGETTPVAPLLARRTRANASPDAEPYRCATCGEPYDPADYEPGGEPRCTACGGPLDLRVIAAAPFGATANS